MRHHRLVAVLALAAAAASFGAATPSSTPATPAPAAPPTPAERAFTKLKSLAGDWTGTVTTRGTGPAVTVRYRVTAGGSAVMETLFPGTSHEMVTLYHKSGAKLVLTHYCAMGNQPEMELAATSTDTEFRFDFAGGTGIAPATDTHMHAGTITFLSPDSIEAHWEVWAGGKTAGHNRFFLTRAATPKS